MNAEIADYYADAGSLRGLVSIGNGKSPLRCLMATLAAMNPMRGITADDACLGSRVRGLKWERRHILGALNNMVSDGQIKAKWDGHQRRFYPLNANTPAHRPAQEQE